MKNVFAYFGAFVAFLTVLGMLNIGHFVMIYSPNKITCTKGVES